MEIIRNQWLFKIKFKKNPCKAKAIGDERLMQVTFLCLIIGPTHTLVVLLAPLIFTLHQGRRYRVRRTHSNFLKRKIILFICN